MKYKQKKGDFCVEVRFENDLHVGNLVICPTDERERVQLQVKDKYAYFDSYDLRNLAKTLDKINNLGFFARLWRDWRYNWNIANDRMRYDEATGRWRE